MSKPAKNQKSTKTHEWDEETRMRIVVRHEDGWSLRQIGESFDPPLARSTVQYIINRPGIQADVGAEDSR